MFALNLRLTDRQMVTFKPCSSFKRVLLLSTAWPRWISGQMLSSHSVVSSSRTVRPCSTWGGRWIGGQHGRRFVLLPHTHRPQRRPYPICTSRSGNVRHRCGGGWAGNRLFLGGSFLEGGYRCLEIKCGVLQGCRPPPHSTDDRPLHRTYVVVVRKTELLCGGYKWVSRFEAPCICTRWMCERWVEQMSRLHGTAC